PLAIEARPRTVTVRFYGAQAGAELPHDLAADNAGDDRLTARQQHVLDHLTQHGSITLRELATLFPGVRSEHLQRDLAHLTAAGHLRKIGPRGGAYYIRS
ncbi:MAG: DeoR family transcriptional regulator, partial [Anaerolineae bacterium]|nr:DeoR family transcriptional regulator [Anaerolineae bacterium]